MTHMAVFGETMVFFTRGNSCQFWGSSTGFFGSGGYTPAWSGFARTHEILLTFGELQVDEHGGGYSESNSHQLSELVV